MPCAIFAGINRNTTPRLRKKLEVIDQNWPDWTFQFLPCHTSEGLTGRLVEAVSRQAADQQGAHVFGISATDDRGRDRVDVAAQLREAFRFRWMPANFPSIINGPDQTFSEVMGAILGEEDYWRQHIQPASCHDALILPSHFSAQNDFKSLWRLSESFNNRPMLERAAKMLPQFNSLHRVVKGNAKAWKDTHDFLWDDYGAHHGNPKFPHDWKYSYQLADRFHFDLTHKHEKKFNYLCPVGNSHPCKAGKHLNVNAHGFVC